MASPKDFGLLDLAIVYLFLLVREKAIMHPPLDFFRTTFLFPTYEMNFQISCLPAGVAIFSCFIAHRRHVAE